MSIEFARNVLGLKGANSTEFDPNTTYPVISLLPEQMQVRDLGGSMRLGAYPCTLVEGHEFTPFTTNRWYLKDTGIGSNSTMNLEKHLKITVFRFQVCMNRKIW